MPERQLQELYGVETKRITEAVKRNIERFPEEFRFQLTEAELAEKIYAAVRLIPRGKVATYSQVAALAGRFLK